jgi:hypothetical protein
MAVAARVGEEFFFLLRLRISAECQADQRCHN